MEEFLGQSSEFLRTVGVEVRCRERRHWERSNACMNSKLHPASVLSSWCYACRWKWSVARKVYVARRSFIITCAKLQVLGRVDADQFGDWKDWRGQREGADRGGDWVFLWARA